MPEEAMSEDRMSHQDFAHLQDPAQVRQMIALEEAEEQDDGNNQTHDEVLEALRARLAELEPGE